MQKVNVIGSTSPYDDALKNHHSIFLKTPTVTGFTVIGKGSVCSQNSSQIIKTIGDTNVSITTMGKNGIAQSANLAGTITTSSLAVTGTGTAFTTDFIVGDVIAASNGQSAVIISISSNTSLTVNYALGSTNNTYKRGGRAREAKLYLYAHKGVTPETDGFLLSARNVAAGGTLVDVPSTLSPTEYRQIMESAIGGSPAAPLVISLNTSVPGEIIPFIDSAFPTSSCVAWAHVEGLVDASVTGTYSQSGTTVTVTVANHKHKVGQSVYTDITSGSGVDGLYTITEVPDANTFKYIAGTSLTTSGNITLPRRKIQAGKNAAFVIKDAANYDFWFVFEKALPDINFMCTGSSNTNTAIDVASGSVNTVLPFSKAGSGGTMIPVVATTWGIPFVVTAVGIGVTQFEHVSLGVFR